MLLDRHANPMPRRKACGLLLGAAALASAAVSRPALARDPLLYFDELYGQFGVLGMSYSDKVKQLAGRKIAMLGFMAPPLKAESQFFVLTKVPMAICPFCSSDADWPDDIVVVYLDRKQTFVPPGAQIEVRGTLETGSWRDPETGFLSLLRLRQARFETT